ncbi:MAG: RuBisCO accumulation factor 1 [Leptolyngbyaceae cyanobacterium]
MDIDALRSMKSPEPNNPTEGDTADLITQLRRKQGNWVSWGQACQALQKTGLSPQKIFEETGFEAIQQNQVIVAAQVYGSLVTAEAPETVQIHFAQRGSDILYELRVLSQQGRVRGASLALTHSLDADTIKDVVKALKEYSYLREPPSGFTGAPGDAVAYHYWKLARQQDDLAARSRLIGQGLRFADSQEARQSVESLLTEFTVIKTRPAPRLPVFRLDDDTELPHIIAVAGTLPLPTTEFQAVPVIVPEAPFDILHFSGEGAWAPIPGWQVIRHAEDPVGLLTTTGQLPNLSNAKNPDEPVLLVVDRGDRDWNDQSYFVADQDGTLILQWFAEVPALKLLGRLILVMRPKRILDETYTDELFQFEE